MSDQTAAGQRFSHVYLEKGDRVSDSPRMRTRLATKILDLAGTGEFQVYRLIQQELGITPAYQQFGMWIQPFFATAQIRDVLDTVTLIVGYLRSSGRNHRVEEWVSFVARVLAEEHLALRVDHQGGVHYYVDEEFSRTVAATISLLGENEFAAVRAEYEKALARLDQKPADTNDAIFSMFKAVEAVYKLITNVGGKDRLGYESAKKRLEPLVLKLYEGSPTATTAAQQAFAGFYDWIAAAHNYRHADGEPTAIPAPLELAVHLIATGSAYLRWLLQLHAKPGVTPTPKGGGKAAG